MFGMFGPSASKDFSPTRRLQFDRQPFFTLHVALSVGLASWTHIGQHSESSLIEGWAFRNVSIRREIPPSSCKSNNIIGLQLTFPNL